VSTYTSARNEPGHRTSLERPYQLDKLWIKASQLFFPIQSTLMPFENRTNLSGFRTVQFSDAIWKIGSICPIFEWLKLECFVMNKIFLITPLL
jgi:hypothetical protein